MNWLDFLLLFLAALFIAEGVRRGLTRQVIGLVSTVLGLLLASWFYGSAGSFLMPYVSSRSVANIAGFLLVFLAIQLLGHAVSWVLGRFYKWTGLSWMDRLLGGLFGFFKTMLVGIVLVMILLAFPLKPVPRSVSHSMLAPYLIEASHMLVYLCPHELKEGFLGSYDRVKELWKSLPKPGSDKDQDEEGKPPAKGMEKASG